MTLLGMLFTVVAVTFIGITLMRVVPVYIQYYSIVQSVKGLAETSESAFSGDPIADTQVLRSRLINRLDINGIDYLKEKNIIITPGDANKFKVQIKYKLVRPLLYNVSLLFTFNRIDEVVVRSEY